VESPVRGPLPDDLTLIETFGRREGVFVRLGDHLDRLARTAAALGVPHDRAAIERALGSVRGADPLRVRLTLARDGTVAVAAAPLGAGAALWRLAVARERLDADDPWLRLKTSERGRYDRVRAAMPEGVDEVVFLNTRGEVCEGTITNVFVQEGEGLLTPPLASGLLPGVLRGVLLRDGRAREAVLRMEDLARGPVYVGNSLRGLVPACLVA
jgi:4-amino-4-deoxychorismate lyase